EKGKKRMRFLAIIFAVIRIAAINPAQKFLVDHVGALAHSLRASIVSRPFRILVQHRDHSEVTKCALDLALVGSVEIDACKLAAVEGANEHVRGRMKIIFEMLEAPAKTQARAEVSPIGGKCSGAIPPLLQDLAERRKTPQSFAAPSQPRRRLNISNPVLELVTAGEQRDVRGQTPRS